MMWSFVGIPLVAILFGILFNRSDVKELRSEMQTRFDKIEDRFDKIEDHLGRIDADLRQFYHLTGNSKLAWMVSKNEIDLRAAHRTASS